MRKGNKKGRVEEREKEEKKEETYGEKKEETNGEKKEGVCDDQRRDLWNLSETKNQGNRQVIKSTVTRVPEKWNNKRKDTQRTWFWQKEEKSTPIWRFFQETKQKK